VYVPIAVGREGLADKGPMSVTKNTKLWRGVWRAVGRGYRTTALVVFNLIVLAVAVELAVQLGWDLSRRLDRGGRVTTSAGGPGGGPVTTEAQLIKKYHLEAYIREKRGVGGITVHNFWPYIMWKRRPHAGRAINIDRTGMRRTWYNPADTQAKRIFCIGGSTTWGDWVADQDTYPSQLAKLIRDRGFGPYRVYNLGQAGYSSTQSLIRLMLELRRGNIPDVVLFLSGINDSLIGTAWPKVPGSIFQVNQIRTKLTRGDTWRTIGQIFFKKLETVRLLRHWGLIRSDPFTKKPPLNPEMTVLLRPGQERLDLTGLVRWTADMYRQNVRQAAALAREYKFEIFFFWQPCLYLRNKPLAPWEKKLVAYHLSRPSLALAFRGVPLVYADIRRRPPANRHFYDLSPMFREHHGLLFADPMHLLAEGNQLLAARIFRTIKPFLKRSVKLAGDRQRSAR
jgi:lysophospholipase L1-like esterase